MASQAPNPVSSKLLLWILLGFVAVSIPLGLFIVRIVAPNVVSSGQRSAEEEAVSKLREILWAEDQARGMKAIDRDGDGRPEFASLGALVGDDGAPDHLPQAPLGSGHWKKLAPGLYQGEGYAYAVYLPAASPAGTGEGGFVASGIGVDGKAASERWLGYAWPVEGGAGQRAFVIDQDERICETDNVVQRYSGRVRAPSADAALPPPPASAISQCGPGRDGAIWKSWRNKKPRASRPL